MGQNVPRLCGVSPWLPRTVLYTVLQAVGIGARGQDILDLGTGTGVLARAFAKQGACVIALDIAAAQIDAARHLAVQEHLTVHFATCAAEEAEFYPRSVDIISCGQSWLYFNTQHMIPLVKQWLKPGGKLVLTYLSWLPRKTRLPRHPSNHAYEEGIPFTRESWRGRIRACRGIGATFPADEVERFDREHEALLRQIAPETFTILHQVWLHAYTPLGDADTMQASPV